MRAVLVAAVLVLGMAGHAGAAGARAPLPEVALELLAEGFNAPVFLVAPDDGSGRCFVGEQAGEIYVLPAGGERLETPFLDLRERTVTLLQAFDERGLLGLAFHPDFATNGLFYVNYSAKLRPGSPLTGDTAYSRRLSEFRVSASYPNCADPASERILLELDWVNRKHNGGGPPSGRMAISTSGSVTAAGCTGCPTSTSRRQAIPATPTGTSRRSRKIPSLSGTLPLLRPLRSGSEPALRQDFADRRRPGPPRLWQPADQPVPGRRPRARRNRRLGLPQPLPHLIDRSGNGDLFVSGVAESLWETIYLVRGPGNDGWAIREAPTATTVWCPRSACRMPRMAPSASPSRSRSSSTPTGR